MELRQVQGKKHGNNAFQVIVTIFILQNITVLSECVLTYLDWNESKETYKQKEKILKLKQKERNNMHS